MFDFFKSKKAAEQPLKPNEMLQKAMQSPDYPIRLREVAKKTLALNEEELPYVEKLIEQLEACTSIWDYPVYMHNVVLIGREKRGEMLIFLSNLLTSIKKDIEAKGDAELLKEYKFVVNKLRKVKKEDTHPHIVYYDLSMFLTSFYTFKVRLCQTMSKTQLESLHNLHASMLSIMRRTRTDKKVAIEKCKQIISDLTPKSELGQA